jgi:Protein of unknown function (DUF3800)
MDHIGLHVPMVMRHDMADSECLSAPHRLPSVRVVETDFLVLHAFVDDSGNNAESPVFVLAGFVLRAGSWKSFDEQWTATLSKPPALAYFKMRECAAIQGQFRGWKQDDRDSRLLEFANIIKDNALALVWALVKWDDFRHIFARVKSPIGRSPYNLVYYSLMAAAVKSMRHFNIEDKIGFIFDEQLHLSDSVQAVYGTVLNNMPSDLRNLIGGRPIHGDDRKYLPLQAADMAAWLIRRWYHAQEKGKIFNSRELQIMRSIPLWGMLHDREGLHQTVQEAVLKTVKRKISEEFSRDGRIGKAILEVLKNNPQ